MSAATGVGAGLSEQDRAELEKFADYMRRVSSAEKAGVTRVEAAHAIYPDVYDDEKASER